MPRPLLVGLMVITIHLPAFAAQAEDLAQPNVPSDAIPPIEAGDEGIWTWVERMEGEVLSEEAMEVLEERAEERFSALSVAHDIGAVDVPSDYYADPRAVLGGDPLHLDKIDPSEFDIPIVVNDSVKASMRYFLGSGRKYFQKWLGRGARYQPMMLAELEKRGLPRDIIYLSMIESGYSSYAYSHAHASGLWQFISSTGRMYGLRIDWWVDERRDPQKATEAAVSFLADLNKMFDGDWHLSFAAYNGGPGRVRRSIAKAGEADFWVLQEGTYLHSETDAYVPKIIAAAIIGKHPERYGFVDIEPLEPLPAQQVKVEGSVELDVLAELAGVSGEYFRLLNPALRRGATPQGEFEVNVPPGVASSFAARLAELPPSQKHDFAEHTVKAGETLSSIAARYDVPTEEVVRANGIANANRIYVGMSLIIPVPGASNSPASGLPAVSDVAESAAQQSLTHVASREHTVGSGETLWGIASTYGVTVTALREWNQLGGSVIQPGQVLMVRGAEAESVSYRVKSGDTLSQIAARYGVSSADVRKWNGINNPSHIQVGQTLTLHPNRPQWDELTVRTGDSLSAIAGRSGCSVDDLVAWNELRSTVIQPGQTLRIKK